MNAKDQSIELANARDGFPAGAAARPASSTFEIVERYRAVLVRIDEAEGEIDDAAAAELDALTSSLDERAEVMAAVCRSLDAEAEAGERFIAHYQDRNKRKRAQATAIKGRLYAAMTECGRTKIVTPTVTAAIQKSPASVELLVPEHEAPAKLPAEYLETRVSIRKDAIKAALQAGTALDFARLTQGSHLRFR